MPDLTVAVVEHTFDTLETLCKMADNSAIDKQQLRQYLFKRIKEMRDLVTVWKAIDAEVNKNAKMEITQ
jgi:hypothetical protein